MHEHTKDETSPPAKGKGSMVSERSLTNVVMRNTMCPLTQEYVGHMEKVCKTCKYPFCSRNTTVAPPQEMKDSDDSGSEVDRKVDSRHNGGEPIPDVIEQIPIRLPILKISKDELNRMIEDREKKLSDCMVDWPKLEEIISQCVVSGVSQQLMECWNCDHPTCHYAQLQRDKSVVVKNWENDQHTSAEHSGEPKEKKDQDEKMYWISAHLYGMVRDLLEKEGLYFSLVKTEHDQTIIVISKIHSPIDGIYIVNQEPKRLE